MSEALPPIVVAAEAPALPGLEAFTTEMRGTILATRAKTAHSRVESWDHARRMYEYGERADVRAAIERMNVLPNGQVRPGRPKTAHHLAADHFVRAGLVAQRTIDRWLAEWYGPATDARPARGVAAALKLTPACSRKEFSAIVAENHPPEGLADWVDGLLARLAEQSGGGEAAPLEPEEAGRKFAQKLFAFMYLRDADGQLQPRFKGRKEKNAMLREANKQLGELGADWELVPVARG